MSLTGLVDELGIYLDLGDSIDTARADLVVELTMARVEAVVSPVPDEARPIVLAVAARAYANTQGAASEQAGPFQRTFHAAGVYLTKRERIDLRRMAGTGGAFTVNPIAAS